MTEKKHSKFSASSSNRWLNCPGSIGLSEKAPPQRESEYAKEGTDAHSCLEMILKNPNKRLSIEAMMMSKYGVQILSHASAVATHIWKLKPEGATLLVEEKCSLDFITPDMGGTCDAAIVEEFGRLTVIDFKYGAGYAVDPEENTQLICYALSIAHQYDYNFKDVSLMIIQPRAHHERGPIREWVISINDLMTWQDKLYEGAQLAFMPHSPLKADPSWCRFCPAAPICPEISTNALKQAKVDFTETGTTLTLPETSAISPEQLGKTLQAIEKLEFWMSEVRAFALSTLKNKINVPGWKLVEKRATRKWADIAKASKVAKKKLGGNAFSEPELLSPAQLEKTLPNKKALVDKFISDHASSVSSGVTIAPESDSRPSVNQAVLDFRESKDITKVSKGKHLQ